MGSGLAKIHNKEPYGEGRLMWVYGIFAINTTGNEENVFKDRRTYTSIKYARKKLTDFNSWVDFKTVGYLKMMKKTRICPHCKHDIGFEGLEDEYQISEPMDLDS